MPGTGSDADAGRPLLILRSIPDDVGWSSIHHMLGLASACFDTPIVDARALPFPSLATRVLGALPPRRRRNPDGPACLLVGASATDLLRVFDLPGWRTRYASIVAWITDSYWVDWIPNAIRSAQPFDRIFITSGEDLGAWKSAFGNAPAWLPWGADALDLGSANEDRPVDLTRVGRQPPEWDDDDATSRDASAAGLVFQPRPPMPPGTSVDNHRALASAFARSKFTLSFSNLAHASSYTHPTRAYVTGRWTDAIASGAVVAGVQPHGACIDKLLWHGATLELDGTGRADGLRAIADAARAWTPDVAARQHAMALRWLDWRHRFATLAEALGVRSERLDRESERLRQTIAETERHTFGMTDRTDSQ